MRWTVDYGDGPRPVELPHAWRQDVPVTWEGPAVYRTQVTVTNELLWLLFHGASYRAVVLIDGREVLTHDGIWDEFSLSLSAFVGKDVDVEVRVTKNGGETFPVKNVLSGFLPYVYHTFGGLYGGVSVVESPTDPTLPLAAPPPCASVEGRKIYVDGQQFFMRGVLSWGWYPELGHTNPDDAAIRREIRTAKAMGFNTIKFCLWVPRHRFFEILEEEGMFAWLELPLWAPAHELEKQEAMRKEIERIVDQFKRHSCIIAWTAGCELGTSIAPWLKKELVESIQVKTRCPLVKDDSGGAEMYRGDLREYGTFDDFHPYCDTHFYLPVIESLRHGPRVPKPILFGEFNDFDVHRDLVALKQSAPYWVSDDPVLNDKGVRWQHDLPRVLRESAWANHDSRTLQESSRSKGSWVRRKVMECVRACPDVSGYVITGWRHTPISTSGMVDDELRPVYQQESVEKWNSETSLFLMPYRRLPWIRGGNRPGWFDPQCHFAGNCHFRVGLHAESARSGRLAWSFGEESGTCEMIQVDEHERIVVGDFVASAPPGDYVLKVEFDGVRDQWPIWVVGYVKQSVIEPWCVTPGASDMLRLAQKPGKNLLTCSLGDIAINVAKEGGTVACFLSESEFTKPMPFWRECAFEFQPGLLDPYIHRWERLFGIATDLALDLKVLSNRFGDCQVLMNRVDTRTYVEHPYMVTAQIGKGKILVTTLRPQGGLGAQPNGLDDNPSGSELFRRIIEATW